VSTATSSEDAPRQVKLCSIHDQDRLPPNRARRERERQPPHNLRTERLVVPRALLADKNDIGCAGSAQRVHFPDAEGCAIPNDELRQSRLHGLAVADQCDVSQAASARGAWHVLSKPRTGLSLRDKNRAPHTALEERDGSFVQINTERSNAIWHVRLVEIPPLPRSSRLRDKGHANARSSLPPPETTTIPAPHRRRPTLANRHRRCAQHRARAAPVLGSDFGPVFGFRFWARKYTPPKRGARRHKNAAQISGQKTGPFSSAPAPQTDRARPRPKERTTRANRAHGDKHRGARAVTQSSWRDGWQRQTKAYETPCFAHHQPREHPPA
jgi:hypothetical protein